MNQRFSASYHVGIDFEIFTASVDVPPGMSVDTEVLPAIILSLLEAMPDQPERELAIHEDENSVEIHRFNGREAGNDERPDG